MNKGAGFVSDVSIATSVQEKTGTFYHAVAALTIVTSLAVLAGWSWDIERFKRLIPGLVSMNPLTAVTFSAAAISFWLLVATRAIESGMRKPARWIGWSCAALVGLVGFAQVSSLLFDLGPGLDQLLFSTKLADDYLRLPNRMAPNTAINFGLLSAALCSTSVTTRRGWRPTELLSATILILSVLNITGYAYGIDQFIGIGQFVPMALPTGILFAILSAGLLVAYADIGYMGIITRNRSLLLLLGGVLPISVLMMLILGGLRLEMQELGLVTQTGGVGLLVLANVLIFIAVLGGCARLLYRHELERRRSETERNRFFELSSSPMSIIGLDGKNKQINPAMTTALGYSQEEMLGEPFTRVLYPDDEPKARAAFGKLLSGDSIVDLEIRCQHRDGTWKWFSWTARSSLSEGLIYTTGLNITELKETQAQLRASEQRVRALLDTAADGIISIDQNGRIETFNQAASMMFGYSADEVLAQNVKMLMPEPYRSQYDGSLLSYQGTGIAKGVETRREVEGLRKDGTVFPIEYNVSKTLIEGKLSFTSIVRDTSERRQYLAQLQQAKRQADEANQAKSRFLAAMSHEIRTPMNGVIGMIDVLRQTSLRGYQVEMVELIQESADTLLQIIDDILDFSKIEAGKLDIDSHPFEVADVVESVCLMLNRLAQNKGVELTVFVDPTLPGAVLGDAQRVRQVLINLTNNAIKFCSQLDYAGHVSVRAFGVTNSSGKSTIEFQVIDNGIGMDAATQAKLFAPFTQAEAATSRRFGGTGLGLAISRQLTELMGGEIAVRSEVSRGATFYVRLPFETASTSQAPAESPPDVAGLSCLVIGGTGGLGSDLATYLDHAGAFVERLHEPSDVGQWLVHAQPEQWILILDVGDSNPTIDELNAMMHLPSAVDIRWIAVVVERGKRNLPRHMGTRLITIDGNALTRKNFLRAVAVAAGREVLEPNDGAPGQGLGGHAVVTVSRQQALADGRLILVAEDNETNQKVILRQLALLSYACDIAEDGEEALERWRSGEYALILSDLHMPKMDGYELTASIRAQEAKSDRIPIIALTANALAGEAEQCVSAGMDGYLSKPARLDELKAVLDQWLQPPSKASTGQDRDSGNQSSKRELTDESMGDEIAVDVGVLEGLVGNDPTLIRELLTDFRRSATDIANELQTAWQAGEITALGAAAHKLKSSARSVGAMTLGELCAGIEQAAKDNQTAILTELLPRFEKAFASVTDFLEKRAGVASDKGAEG